MNDVDQVGDLVLPVATLAWDELFEGAPDASVQSFVPFLDEGCRLGMEPALHLLGRSDDDGTAFSSIWTYGDDVAWDQLQGIFAWMWSRADLWPVWGRAAIGLGPSFLTRIVQRGAAAAEPLPLPPYGSDACETDDAADVVEDAEDDDADPEDDVAGLWCHCKEDGYGRGTTYRICLSYGRAHPDREFFWLRFDKASERDRVWDWMQHQTERYREFEAFFHANGKDALKKLIFGGMLETERAVKKMGLGSGGTRPLRFWPGPQAEASDA